MINSRPVLSFFAICFTTGCLCQEVQWIRHYGSLNGGNGCRGIHLTDDESEAIYGTGSLEGPLVDMQGVTLNIVGRKDLFIAKWSPEGIVLWAKNFGGQFPSMSQSDTEEGNVIKWDSQANEIVVAGTFNTICPIGTDTLWPGWEWDEPRMFVARFDTTGACLWARQGSGDGYSIPTAMLCDGTSVTHVFGNAPFGVIFPSTPEVNLLGGGFVARYSSSGDLLSASRIAQNAYVNNASWVGDEHWALAGRTTSSSGALYDQDIIGLNNTGTGFVSLADTAGNVQWLTPFPSTHESDITDCVRLSSNRLLVHGYFQGSLILPSGTIDGPTDHWTAFLASMDMSGSVQWVVPLTSSTSVIPCWTLGRHVNGDVSMIGSFVNDIVIGGHAFQANTGQDGYVARFDSLGVCVAASQFGRVSSIFDGSILPVGDGLLISCPYDSTFTFGNVSVPTTGTDKMYSQDLVLLKLDTLAGFTGIEGMVLEEELHIYANPNNGICTVDLPSTVATGSRWQLVIRDNSGRIVDQTPLTISDGGVIRLDIQAQAKGLYHVELIGDRQRYSGQLVFE